MANLMANLMAWVTWRLSWCLGARDHIVWLGYRIWTAISYDVALITAGLVFDSALLTHPWALTEPFIIMCHISLTTDTEELKH